MTKFPFHPQALTSAWLTDRLRESGAIDKAGVTSFRCAPVDPHNGVTGVLVRLRLYLRLRGAGGAGHPGSQVFLPEPGSRPWCIRWASLSGRCCSTPSSRGLPGRDTPLLLRWYRPGGGVVPPPPRRSRAGPKRQPGPGVVARAAAGGRRRYRRGARRVVASPRLDTASRLTMTGLLAVEQMQEVVTRCWEPFLARLSVPVTPAITEAGELASHHLHGCRLSAGNAAAYADPL